MKNASILIEGVDVTVCQSNDPPLDVVQSFQKADRLYFDTETTGFSPFREEMGLLQIYEPNSKQCLLARIPEDWQPEKWFTDLFIPTRTWVGHNIAQFDLPFLASYGIPWKNSRYFDTLIGETIVSTTNRSRVSKSLRASVKRRSGYIVDKDIEHGHWRAESLSEKQIQYAATDTLVLPELMDAQLENAVKTGQLPALKMEMQVMPMFVQMTVNGLPINQKKLDEYMADQRTRYKEAEKILFKRLGNINYGSPIQLRNKLNSLGIDIESTAKGVLVDLIQFDPESENAALFQAILDWRAPHKRTEMYGSEDWQNQHIQYDGRIHAKFWQVGADTTRVSASDPNLQQVPKDGRFVFGWVPDHKIVSVDYSQIEIRIAASIGNDLVLIEMLQHDDVHAAIASQVFKCLPSEVTPIQRKLAKAMVFTLLFGGSWKVLYLYAKRSGSTMTEEEAIELFHSFFSAFRGLWAMRQKAYALCRTRNIIVVTLPNSSRRILAGSSKRPTILLNTPVQGTAAVGMKLGLIEALNQGLDKYVGAVVHDEAVACVPNNEAKDYANTMQECLVKGMQKVVQSCPVKASIAYLKDGSLPDYWLP